VAGLPGRIKHPLVSASFARRAARLPERRGGKEQGMARLRHTPASVMAQVFVALQAKHGNFAAQLSVRLRSLPPLTQLRIGGLINFMHDRKVIDRASCASISGDYPDNRMQSGGTNYLAISDEVANALQALQMGNALTAAANAVVGIQESIVMLGVGKVLGKVGDAWDKWSNGQTAYSLISDWVKAQYGDPVDVFINAM
jgi:hypothetical protein